jgi:hypothetical protein
VFVCATSLPLERQETSYAFRSNVLIRTFGKFSLISFLDQSSPYEFRCFHRQSDTVKEIGVKRFAYGNNEKLFSVRRKRTQRNLKKKKEKKEINFLIWTIERESVLCIVFDFLCLHYKFYEEEKYTT